MPSLKSMVWLVLLSLLMVQPGHALESEDCSYTKWRKIENLAAALADHKDWTAKRGVRGSGNFLSPHYADLLPRWRDGEYIRVAGTRDDVGNAAIGTLFLLPAEKSSDGTKRDR